MKNIKPDRYGYRCYVKVGKLQDEKHYPPGTSVKTMQDWIDEARVALRKKPQAANGHHGTFGADVKAYLAAVKPTIDPATYASRICNLAAYVAVFRSEPRGTITRGALLALRTQWLETGRSKRTGQIGTAPKTIRNREADLRHLFHHFDGRKATTPIDDLPALPRTQSMPQFVPAYVIKRVLAKLTEPKTRARFMVLAATGQRPAQVKRALPADVDLRRRLWLVRPAKGGNPIPIVLTGDMLKAWKAFRAADAWGVFDGSDYAKALYAAGWPKHIPPYHAKHTVAIALGEAGAEWEDIKDWFGHTDVKTTRIYTGLIAARAKRTSAKLEGRLGF